MIIKQGKSAFKALGTVLDQVIYPPLFAWATSLIVFFPCLFFFFIFLCHLHTSWRVLFQDRVSYSPLRETSSPMVVPHHRKLGSWNSFFLYHHYKAGPGRVHGCIYISAGISVQAACFDFLASFSLVIKEKRNMQQCTQLG